MTLFVIRRAAPVGVLLLPAGDLVVVQPAAPDVVVAEAPDMFVDGDLDFSRPGDPLAAVA